MCNLRLVSLERPTATSERWVLTLEVPSAVLGESSGQAPAVHVSAEAVRVESADGAQGATFSLPAECDPIDDERATCRLSRRRGQLVVAWPGATGSSGAEPCDDPSRRLGTAGPSAEPLAQTAANLEHASLEKSCLDVGCAPAATPATPASKMTPSSVAAVRASLDYSRFDSIGDDAEDKVGAAGWEKNMSEVAAATAGTSSTPVSCAPAPALAPRSAKTSLDYSRFEDVVEEDATLEAPELEHLWRRHRKLQRMRGEEPADFGAWRRSRARQPSNSTPEGEKLGRGLWSRTNLEDTFAQAAGQVDMPPEEELPTLPAPELLSAMSAAPGVQVVDVNAWACSTLRTELVKACATDRVVGGKDANLRIDVIAHAVEVKEGNAGIVVEGRQFLCAYRFAVEIAYSVAVSERPAPGQDAVEARYMGDIHIPELCSGILGPGDSNAEAMTKHMRTSLREPKPHRRHLSAMRPVLARLELSLAYFVRRFERLLLSHPSES